MEKKFKYLVVELTIDSANTMLFDTFLKAKEYITEQIDAYGMDKDDVKIYQVTKSYSITTVTVPKMTDVVVTADDEIVEA